MKGRKKKKNFKVEGRGGREEEDSVFIYWSETGSGIVGTNYNINRKWARNRKRNFSNFSNNNFIFFSRKFYSLPLCIIVVYNTTKTVCCWLQKLLQTTDVH